MPDFFRYDHSGQGCFLILPTIASTLFWAVGAVKDGESCGEAFGWVMLYGVCYAVTLPFYSIALAVSNLLGCKYKGGLKDEEEKGSVSFVGCGIIHRCVLPPQKMCV